MGYFILNQSWFLLHGIIRHLGLNPWQKMVLEDGSVKLKSTKSSHYWLRFFIIMILVSLVVTILNGYMFLYELSWEDLKAISSYFNESPLDLGTVHVLIFLNNIISQQFFKLFK